MKSPSNHQKMGSNEYLAEDMPLMGSPVERAPLLRQRQRGGLVIHGHHGVLTGGKHLDARCRQAGGTQPSTMDPGGKPWENHRKTIGKWWSFMVSNKSFPLKSTFKVTNWKDPPF